MKRLFHTNGEAFDKNIIENPPTAIHGDHLTEQLAEELVESCYAWLNRCDTRVSVPKRTRAWLQR